jgi:nucleoside-diphosphate-sugar epimerase
MTSTMKRILITGGAGYVGSMLTQSLLNRGYYVRVLDNLTYGGRGLLPCFIFPNFEFIRGDVLDLSVLRNAIDDADAIVHLAAIVGYPACKKSPELAKRVNVDGTIAVASIRRKDQHLIYASTGSNYGAVTGQLCTEETPLGPLTVYGQTKTEAERQAMSGGNATALRFSTAFGVSNRMRLDLLINDFVYQATKNHNLIIYEHAFKRTFIHVTDMVDAFIFCIENPQKVRDQVFNCGDEANNCSKLDVANMIREHVDFYLHLAEIGKDEDQRNYEVSFEKMRKAGFRPKVSVPAGVSELIRAFAALDVPREFANV